MDPVANPFVPGAGTPPPELTGRSSVLEQAGNTLRRVKLSKPSKSIILVGLRGVGKTVLLVRIRELADSLGYKAVLVEAHEGKPLPSLLVPPLRQTLFALDKLAGAKDKARRGLRVLRSFVSGLKLTIGEIDIGLSIEPERGVADSGDLESDLSDLLVVVGEAAKAGGSAVALCIDELQYLSGSEFSALIMALHKVNQLNLPLVAIGAGLPQILALAGESKSYSERLFEFPSIGALPEHDARAALQEPAKAEGAMFSDDALNEILRITERYPYFLQQWGHEAWNVAKASPIGLEDISAATTNAIQSLDQSFFRVRFDRCTPSEKRYLRALAELGAGPQRSGDIALKLGVKVTTVAPTRSKLILKGMIYAPQHGDTAFTVPLFDAYMKRVMSWPVG